MTTRTHRTKRKLSLLELAQELGKVARACKIMSFHRDTFYEVRRALHPGGVAALIDNRRGASDPQRGRSAPPEIEARVAGLLPRPP